MASIEEEECIDYAYNLVLNRTYEGYTSEIDTIYGQLESILNVKIPPDPWQIGIPLKNGAKNFIIE